jgi:hypothetical protein
VAGGAASQVLGLMSGIYAGLKLKMPFKIKFYPYSTGTYWPCILEPFLENHEILNLATPTRGLIDVQSLEVGKIIDSHPLLKKSISVEKIISILRSMKVLSIQEMLRREKALHAQPNRLLKLNYFYKSISGGFPHICEEEVNKEMNRRFIKAGIESPFAKKRPDSYTVIHYRLGDKRAIPYCPKDFAGGDRGIIDPKLIADLVNRLSVKEKIYIVSDEPELAQQLLSEAGLFTQITNYKGSFWEDINFMANASIFIGSHSTVSRLTNIFVEYNGGRSYLINVEPNPKYNKFTNTTYLKAKFLPFEHKVYQTYSILPTLTHSSYETPPILDSDQ